MLFFGGIFCFFNIFLFSLVVIRNYIVDPHQIVMSTIANFEWNFYDCIMIFIIIRSTTAASGEGKRTMSVIYKLVNASTDGKLNGRVGEIDVFFCFILHFFSSCQLMNFSQQVLSSRLDFSCGLFNYDWSLCFKVPTKNFTNHAFF